MQKILKSILKYFYRRPIRFYRVYPSEERDYRRDIRKQLH